MKYQKAWIFYFWITLFLFVLDIVQEIRGQPNLTPSPYYFYGIKVIAFIGLYGFAYQKKIGGVLTWRVFFALHSFFIYKIIVALYDTANIVDINGVILAIMAALIFFTSLPMYYANFSYAFRSKNIWTNSA